MKRNFTCDCGTTRMASNGGCNLRKNFDSLDPPESVNNNYSHNFEGKFCHCDEKFVPEEQKGTMFQCLLGDVCNEDWFHEECILGLPLGSVYRGDKKPITATVFPQGENVLDKLPSAIDEPSEDIKEQKPDGGNLKKENSGGDGEEEDDDDDDDDPDNQTLEGLPNVNDFDSYVCWKCVEKYRSIFEELVKLDKSAIVAVVPHGDWKTLEERGSALKKRAVSIEEKDGEDEEEHPAAKKIKTENGENAAVQSKPEPVSNEQEDAINEINPKYGFSVFLSPHFRIKFKHALSHRSRLPETSDRSDGSTKGKSTSASISSGLREFLTKTFPFLTEEELVYEPPEDDDAHSSLLEAGTRALNDMPRPQAIQCLEAYSIMKEKLSNFFKPFAEQGKVVTEEDVTGFFSGMDQEKKDRRGY